MVEEVNVFSSTMSPLLLFSTIRCAVLFVFADTDKLCPLIVARKHLGGVGQDELSKASNGTTTAISHKGISLSVQGAEKTMVEHTIQKAIKISTFLIRVIIIDFRLQRYCFLRMYTKKRGGKRTTITD